MTVSAPPSSRLAGGVAAVAVLVGVVALSALVLPVAPGYDAWAWLAWGREVGRLELSTVDGPAWKPLPVAVTTVLAPAGDAAPALWVLLVRASAVAALALAFTCARRLGGTVAGVAAATALALTGGFVRHAAVGDAEPMLVALALGAFALALDGRHRGALMLGGMCALLRPEVWPFLAVYGAWCWRGQPAARPALAALAVAVPVLWFVPEWLGSGELLRSGERARIPNPGQPATAEHPAWQTLAAAAGVVFAPAALVALLARGTAALLAAAGAAWIVLVAFMSEAGFSGEPRYLLPGAALLAVAGGAALPRLLGLVDAPRRRHAAGLAAAGAIAVLAVVDAVPRAAGVADLRPRLAHQAALADGLQRAIADAGGRDRVLACGRPAVGRYRGTLLAWHLDVPKSAVRADGRPDAVTFRSRLTARAVASPPLPARGRVLATAAGWRAVAAEPC